MDPKDKAPSEPPTMKHAAVALHELYLSYKAAGFSQDQAFQLILAHVTPILNGQHKGES